MGVPTYQTKNNSIRSTNKSNQFSTNQKNIVLQELFYNFARLKVTLYFGFKE